MRRLLTGAALALVSGGVAHADARDIIPDLRAACRPDPGAPAGYGVIAAAKVRDVAHEQFPLPPGVWAQGVDAMADRAMAPPPYSSDDDRQLSRYGLMIRTWSGVSGVPREPALGDAGLRIEPTGAGADVRARLVQMFKGDPSLRILCPSPVPEPPPPTASTGPFFVLVKQASDFDEADFADGGVLPLTAITKRSFAEITYVDDREARVQSWAVKLAAAVQWPELGWTARDSSSYVKFNPRMFVGYDRQGENDPDADGYVNNLDFGAQVSGRFGLGRTTSYTGYYAVSTSYRTDDDFRSEAYAAEVALDPPLPYMPYHRGYRAIGHGPVAIDFKWGANLVADWVQVDDPGRRTELVDQAEYFRLGYDTGFDLRFGPATQDWRFLLSVDYGVRDGQTKDGGDAQMFTSSLLFLDRPTTNFSFGLSYERGENLQSFEKSELWKLVFGARY
ncbi:hypothetical protein [Phenylobacterium sp.]|uniref:hypothetical protein n=1 Tax=Phenylobacterium sp. TaxID=1871053 RepID=UPI003BACE9D8